MKDKLELPKKVVVHDVTVRDGFQSEQHVVPAEVKLWIIRPLLGAGVKHLEVAAFAPPRYQPQFRDIDQVLANLPDQDDAVHDHR